MMFLAVLGMVGVLGGYLPALEGPNTPARAAAIDSLAAGDGPEALGEALRTVGWRAREGIVDALTRIGPAALPVLARTARRNPRVDARRLAVLAMGRIGGPAARDSLLGFLNTPERDLVLLGLGETGDSTLAPVIARFLKDGRPDVRRRAAVALGKTAGAAGADRLIDMLSDPYYGVRFAAAGALEAIGPTAGAALLGRFRHLSWRAQFLAVQVLGRLAYRPAAGVLGRALRSKDWAIRAEAARALGRLDLAGSRPLLARALKRETQPFVRDRIRSSLHVLDAR